MPSTSPTLLHELTRLISKARRGLYLAAARELGSRGEEMSAWIVAARLVERRAASQKDLADITGQHPAGISRLLDEMDRRGLTARAPDPLDQRRRLVTLTPAGSCDTIARVSTPVPAAVSRTFVEPTLATRAARSRA